MSETPSPVIRDEPWLQPGEVLIHVGPRKTGSSSIQMSLARADDKLRDLGFFLAPKRVDGSRAAEGAYLNHRRKMWRTATDIVNQRGPRDRGLVSDELLYRLNLQQAEKVVKTLGGPDRVRILITNRPLTKSLPSQWQQLVKSSRTSDTLSQWLRMLLADPEDPEWHSLRLDRFYNHWSQVVPADRIAILPVGYGPSDLLLDFERLTGIPENLLKRRQSNTSLNAEQVEMFRIRNRVLAKANVVQLGRKVDAQARRRLKNGTPIVLPEWARPQVNAIQTEVTEHVIARDAFVVGGTERLQQVPDLPPETQLSDDAQEFARFAGRYMARMIISIAHQIET